jgi:copper chaperone
MTFIFTVKGMNCGHCTQAITKAIAGLDPQAKVDTDIPKQTVTVTSGLDRKQLSDAIVDAGYDIVAPA